MGIVGTDPVAEGLVGRSAIEEFGEGREFWSGGIAVSAGTRFLKDDAGTPAFDLLTHTVAGVLEELGVGAQGVRPSAPEIGGFAESVTCLAGEENGSGRRAGRDLAIGVGEKRSFAGNAVEIRRGNNGISASRSVGIGPVISENEKNVGSLVRQGKWGEEKEQCENQATH